MEGTIEFSMPKGLKTEVNISMFISDERFKEILAFKDAEIARLRDTEDYVVPQCWRAMEEYAQNMNEFAVLMHLFTSEVNEEVMLNRLTKNAVQIPMDGNDIPEALKEMLSKMTGGGKSPGDTSNNDNTPVV